MSELTPLIAQAIVSDTRNWLERAVIGLNLCPFAKAVHQKGQIHFAVSGSTSALRLLDDVNHELDALTALPATVRETTLLIAPYCLEEFLTFNQFLGQAQRLISRRGLQGVVQLASFHPCYQFAGTLADDMGNCTNRSPYPTLHLLRESSVDRAVRAFPAPEAIYETNIQTLVRLGPQGWTALRVGPST